MSHEKDRMDKPLDTAYLAELLGKPIQVNDEIFKKCLKADDFAGLAFELYKEAGKIVGVCCHLHDNPDPNAARLTRNQAICAGLLVRIAKFMIAIVQLASSKKRAEVIFALNRSVLESATNLKFLVLKNDERFFDQFLRSSLGPERELYNLIRANIEARKDK